MLVKAINNYIQQLCASIHDLHSNILKFNKMQYCSVTYNY